LVRQGQWAHEELLEKEEILALLVLLDILAHQELMGQVERKETRVQEE